MPKVKGPSAGTIDTSLDVIKMTSTLATTLGESIPISGLKTAGGIIGQIITIVQQMRQNQQDALSLLEQINDYGSALIEATNGRVEDELPDGLIKSIESYRLALAKIKEKLDKCNERSRCRWQLLANFFKANRVSVTIMECKADLGHALNIYMLKGSTRIQWQVAEMHTNSTNTLTVEVIPVSSLDLLLENDIPGLFVARQDDKHDVLAKRYDSNATLLQDLAIYRKKMHPSLLQVCGRTNGNPCHLVFRNPGKLAEDVFRSAPDPSRLLLDVIHHLIKAVGLIVESDIGHDKACVFKRSRLYIRNNGGQLVPVIADFEPSASDKWDPNDSNGQNNNKNVMTQGLFSAFVSMLNRAVTGDEWKPNFTKSNHGRTGISVIGTLRFFFHYLYDYIGIRCGGSPEQVVDKLAKEVPELLQKLDARMSALDDLLIEQRPHDICAMWDIWDPLDVEVGDLGYMTGSDPLRPQFEKIDNIRNEMGLPVAGFNLSEPFESLETVVNLRPLSGGVWSADAATDSNPVRRYTLHLGDAIFEQGKPQTFCIFRGYMYRRLGMHCQLGRNPKVEYNRSWAWMQRNREKLRGYASGHHVSLEDIILIQTVARSDGYTEITLNSEQDRDRLLLDVEAIGGKLYYYDNLEAEEGHVTGYWSISDQPGSMLWPPTPDPLGPEWGWVHKGHGFEVEIKRKGPRQVVRYVSLKETACLELVNE